MASPAHRKNLGVWFGILPLQKQQLLSPAELGAESWVWLPFTRCRSFQPCMSSETAMSYFTSNAGSTSVDRLLCWAIFWQNVFMLCIRRMGIFNKEKNTLAYNAYLYLLSAPQQPSVPLAI